ncbi:hypothetical protein [Roseateles puraquae]|uniref:General secretion pathway protein GspM n=1 Tax=Roseateles puraquae TaxID=431059 RepID=A0A254MYT3_9BURK|nr:hypothetical protein [Roseateles puraquae]MDG0857481.1 hypothetical protein [Roseateles puraquae]OWQ96773.1 hypothetical protein CDO81_27090 [Roseateles puraquae]
MLAVYISLVVFLGVAFWNESRGREEAELRRWTLERSELQDEISKQSLTRNFASQLPERIDASIIPIKVQRLAAENSVVLINLAPSKDAGRASVAGLSQQIWALQLSGNYLNVKSFLAQLLDQSPELWLTHLDLKAEGASVLAQVGLQAWSIEKPAEPAHSGVAP